MAAGVRRALSQGWSTVTTTTPAVWKSVSVLRRTRVSKASKATKHLHDLLEDLTRRVIDGELETSRGAVANQLIGTRIRLLEYERRLKELEEFEARIEALELAQQDGGEK